MMKAVMAKVASALGAAILLSVAGQVWAQNEAQSETQGDAQAGASKITTCVACHGEGGNDSLQPDVPKIGGQSADYLFKQLVDIKGGSREAPLMVGMVASLSEQDMRDIAAYYASQEAPQGAADPDKIALGEKLYRSGNAEIGVAACTACHQPTGSGLAAAGYPALSGQDVAYTINQLKAFRSGERANDDSSIMRTLAERLTDAEIEAVASYVSGLR